MTAESDNLLQPMGHLAGAQQRLSSEKRERVTRALQAILDDGHSVTFAEVARRALLTELRGGSPHVNGDVVASGATVSACDRRR